VGRPAEHEVVSAQALLDRTAAFDPSVCDRPAALAAAMGYMGAVVNPAVLCAKTGRVWDSLCTYQLEAYGGI
jgi:hypothetical protein